MKDLIEQRKKKTRRLVRILIVVAVAMFAFGFLLVPLYNVLCQAIGLNGKTNNKPIAASNNAAINNSRTITMQFVATNNANLSDWEFRPTTKSLKIHPNENVKVTYYAKNNSSHARTVQAIPSVSPGAAASHLRKMECFCFQKQKFKAGEAMEMPLMFVIDDKLPKDINKVTLSYTVFDITDRS